MGDNILWGIKRSTTVPFLGSSTCLPYSPAYGVFISQTGLAPYMNVLFWGPGEFRVSYPNKYTSWIARNCDSGCFMVDTGIYFSNMKSSSYKCKRLKLYQLQWLPNRSDFSSISLPWYRTWPSLNYEWFPWSICKGCRMPAGNAYPSRHLVPSLGLSYAPIVATGCSEFIVSFLNFSPIIFLGTFSSLLQFSTDAVVLSF